MKVDTGQPPPPHKGCNSNTCCSPARLWRTLQNLIKDDNRKNLLAFFKDPRQEHILRVALTQRVANDPSSLPASHRHTLVRFSNSQLASEAQRILGKSLTDLNALQLALLTSSESTALLLLNQLKHHAKPAELKLFIHHLYGQGNSSLHLAVFLNRPRVVKALIDLGASADCLNGRKKNLMDCCRDPSMVDLLQSFSKKKKVIQKQDPPKKEEVSPVLIPPIQKEIQLLDPLLFFENHQLNSYLTHVSYLCLQTIIHHAFYQSIIQLPQQKKPPDITSLCY
jgi:hypothetical protein